MSKKVLFAIIVVAILAVGGGLAYTLTKSDTDNASQTKTSTSNQAATQTNSSVKASLASFLTSSDSKKCTYSFTLDGRQTTGTVYYANQKMRMNYSSTSDGKTQSGSMIVTNGTQYLWSSDSDQGVKFAFTTDTAKTQTASQNVDINQQYDFKCSDWQTDQTAFTPPANVKFQDLSQIQSQIGQ